MSGEACAVQWERKQTSAAQPVTAGEIPDGRQAAAAAGALCMLLCVDCGPIRHASVPHDTGHVTPRVLQ